MKKDKYIAYSAECNEQETFETFEEAKTWLEDGWNEDASEEGYSECTINGEDYIAKITHRSHYEITERCEDYWKYEDEEDAEGKDEWPYDNAFDFVGKLTLEEVE